MASTATTSIRTGIEKAVFALGAAGVVTTLALGEKDYPYDRLYIGSETCTRLLPGAAELRDLQRRAVRSGISISLVTPVSVDDEGLEQLWPLLSGIDPAAGIDEVVFNDWGVLEILKPMKHFRLVMGRMLNRMKRDPRIDFADFNAAELSLLRSCNLGNETYVNFLKDRRVDRVEFDNVPQGIDIPPPTLSMGRSLYYPFIPVSFSNFCIMGASRHSGPKRFAPGVGCQRECLDYAIDLGDGTGQIIGKAVYMQNESLQRVDMQAFDRVVRVLA